MSIDKKDGTDSFVRDIEIRLYIYKDLRILGLMSHVTIMVVGFVILTTSTIPHKNNETNDKFYRKVAFLCLQKWLILGLKAEKQLRN